MKVMVMGKVNQTLKQGQQVGGKLRFTQLVENLGSARAGAALVVPAKEPLLGMEVETVNTAA